MARDEKSFPLVVDIESGLVRSCDTVGCKKWGSGVLFVEKRSETSGSMGQVTLSAAGCEVCSNLMVGRGDLDVIEGSAQEYDVPFEEAPNEEILSAARHDVAAKVNSLPVDSGEWGSGRL